MKTELGSRLFHLQVTISDLLSLDSTVAPPDDAVAAAGHLADLGGGLFAAPYAEGSKVESFSAKDQHEQAFTLKPSETKYLLVSHDMETGKKANAALNALGKAYLGSKNAVYVANIHGMPGIGRLFAMPKMRKYVHRIILGDDEVLIAKFPEQKGKVTVLKLDDGKVGSISYWTPGTEALEDTLK